MAELADAACGRPDNPTQPAGCDDDTETGQDTFPGSSPGKSNHYRNRVPLLKVKKMAEKSVPLDEQILALRQSSTYVSTSYRLCPDELTALKQSLVLFAEANVQLVKRVCELESICPRIVDVDGRKIRWNAPDNMIPVESL